jgi:hypothetical protein
MLRVKVKELFFKKNNVIGYINHFSLYFGVAKLLIAIAITIKTIALCDQSQLLPTSGRASCFMGHAATPPL